MAANLIPPTKLQPGDRIAVLSPSFAAPGRAPAVHELSMQRLRDELQLEPVEYPTTRRQGTPAERAADLQAAFADPSIGGVLATIGGEDQITLLRYLDPAVFTDNPKPFAGYSDNTNLLNWLWFHGLGSYHGGSTIVHLGRGGGTHPASIDTLRAALFETGDRELRPVDTFNEDEWEWDDPRRLREEGPQLPAEEWSWHQPDRVVTGPTWGGNLEILAWVLEVSRHVHPPEAYAGSVLLLETSEEMPSGEYVYRTLRNMGERGLLEQFPAALFARPKASFILDQRTTEQRVAYRAELRAAVLRAFAEYAPDAMVVFGVDFGHTDPQFVLPYGGEMTVDGPNRRLVARY